MPASCNHSANAATSRRTGAKKKKKQFACPKSRACFRVPALVLFPQRLDLLSHGKGSFPGCCAVLSLFGLNEVVQAHRTRRPSQSHHLHLGPRCLVSQPRRRGRSDHRGHSRRSDRERRKVVKHLGQILVRHEVDWPFAHCDSRKTSHRRILGGGSGVRVVLWSGTVVC